MKPYSIATPTCTPWKLKNVEVFMPLSLRKELPTTCWTLLTIACKARWQVSEVLAEISGRIHRLKLEPI